MSTREHVFFLFRQVFILHFFYSVLRHQGYSVEKINRAMILAPLVGIVLNLSTANVTNEDTQHDLASTLLNVDVSSVAVRNFESLVLVNWVRTLISV
jgi:Kip1 ubiquitination-promoting complex protein 1